MEQSSRLATRLLSDHGASIHTKDHNNRSPLFDTVDSCKVDGLEAIYQNEPSVANETFTDGDSPLHIATRNCDWTAIKTLLEYGAEVKVKNLSNWTLLQLAIGYRHIDILRLLLQKDVDCMSRGFSGKSLLHNAIETHNVEVVKLLLSITCSWTQRPRG